MPGLGWRCCCSGISLGESASLAGLGGSTNIVLAISAMRETGGREGAYAETPNASCLILSIRGKTVACGTSVSVCCKMS